MQEPYHPQRQQHTVKTDTTEGAVSSLKDMQTLQITIGTGNRNDIEIQP